MLRPIAAREDVVLTLADGAEGGAYPFDPVRLMKGCFVVAQAGREPWRELFNYRPYDYGPFDPSVYASRDLLLADGRLRAAPSGRYDAYSLTELGRVSLGELEPADDVAWLERVGAWVASKSFSRLLDEIYARWPEYATESIRW